MYKSNNHNYKILSVLLVGVFLFITQYITMAHSSEKISPLKATYISKDKITNVILKSISKKMLGTKYEIELFSNYDKVKFNSDTLPKINIETIKLDNKTGLFTASISFNDIANNKIKDITIKGRAYQLVTMPVIATRLNNGDIITKEDIKYITVRVKEIPTNTILNGNELIGKTPRRFIDAMSDIQPNEIITPKIIKKGEKVTISIKRGALRLSTIGKALDAGSRGDIIRVMNLMSHKIIDAEVISPREVIIPNLKTL